MALTPQREKFAQIVADGKSQSEAYRIAYPKAVNWKDDSVHNRASALMRNTQVYARTEELRQQLAEKQLWTREEAVATLRKVITEYDKVSDITAAVKELNAMHGFSSLKVTHEGIELTGFRITLN